VCVCACEHVWLGNILILVSFGYTVYKLFISANALSISIMDFYIGSSLMLASGNGKTNQ